MAPSSPRHESKIQGLSKTVGRAHSARQFRRTRHTGAARLPPHVRAARAVRAERPLPTSTTSKPDVKPALRVDDRGNFCQGTQTTRIQDTVVGCSLFFFPNRPNSNVRRLVYEYRSLISRISQPTSAKMARSRLSWRNGGATRGGMGTKLGRAPDVSGPDTGAKSRCRKCLAFPRCLP